MSSSAADEPREHAETPPVAPSGLEVASEPIPAVEPTPIDELDPWVVESLREVLDPELGLDIVELGLVYAAEVTDDRVTVDMTLTTVGCPVSESLPAEAADMLRLAFPDREVEVRLVWAPAWTPERLSPRALEVLGFTR